jgi:exodeoxyribonuclease V gamma subunit
MPFTLHTSNKTENLFSHLAMVLERPLSSPFKEELFLIQSQGMERWLLQMLADRFGVWGNYQFLFPARFFNTLSFQIGRGLNPAAFERENMVWRFEQALRSDIVNRFPELENYIGDEDCETASAKGRVERRRFQLAQQLAQIFDQYQIMRPDWLADGVDAPWSDSPWQKELWDQLLHDMKSSGEKIVDRGQSWLQVIELMRSIEVGAEFADKIPERISLFGINTMPPLFLNFIQALSLHTDIHLYLLQPCGTYWADIKSRAQLKRDQLYSLSISNLDSDDIGSEEGQSHPLLSLLGQQGRDFQQMILEQGEFDWEFDSFEEEAGGVIDSAANEPETQLHRLQSSIVRGEDPRYQFDNNKLIPADNSISLHSCHSPMREVQVLKDYLLLKLDSDHNIELRDIVVMAPDISIYEPFISALFNDENFRYSVADRSLMDSNSLLNSFIELLKVLIGRFEWDSVIELLERDSIYPTFNLTEDDLSTIRFWIGEVNIRWGVDAQQRKKMGLPEISQNSWDAGLSQLIMGFVMQERSVEIEGGGARPLGGLDYFVRDILFKSANKFEENFTLRQWSEHLLLLIDRIFIAESDSVDERELNSLRKTIEGMSEFPSESSYSLAVVIEWLESSSSEQKNKSGFMDGQLTFCSMLPMRSIPFKMIALLGLNDGEFPKLGRSPSFDLMSSNSELPNRGYRIGDRSSRVDDRYQFLDLIMSARKSLYLSYVGQSLKSNTPIPPSVVVAELQEVVELKSVVEAMHPFSHRYFSSGDRGGSLRSYDQYAAKAGDALNSNCRKKQKWWRGGSLETSSTELNSQQGSLVELRDLLSFYRDPQKHFINRVVDLHYTDIQQSVESAEPFDIDGLEKYEIERVILNTLMRGEKGASRKSLAEKILASGGWLSGEIGAQKIEETLDSIELFLVEWEKIDIGEQIAPLTVKHKIVGESGSEIEITGLLDGQYERGVALIHYVKLKPKHYIAAWISYLLSNREVHLLGLSESKSAVHYRFGVPDGGEDAADFNREQELKTVLDIYQQGLQRPISLWVNAGWEYISKQERGDDVSLKAALTKLRRESLGEGFDAWDPSPEVEKIREGVAAEEIFDEDFEYYCSTLLSKIKKYMVEVTL